MTPEQERDVLKMLEDHNRARWAWNAISILAKWITTVVGGITAAYMAWKYMVTDFIKGG
jgi:hypothetical protein